MRVVTVVAGWLTLVASMPAADLSPGTWRLSYARGSDAEIAACLIRLEPRGDGWAAALVAGNTQLGRITVGDVAVADKLVRIKLLSWETPALFEGVLGGDGAVIRGSYSDGSRVVAATLTPTTDERIDRDNMMIPVDLPGPMREYLKLEANRAKLAFAVQAQAGASLPAENDAVEQLRQLDRAAPELLKAVLKDHASHPSAHEAALQLLAGAYRTGAPTDQVRAWSEQALASAARFGPSFRREVLVRAAEYVGRDPRTAGLAAELARQADAALGSDAPAERRARNLAVLLAALPAGESQPIAQRLAELEAARDAAATRSLPKFDVRRYAGRKNPKGRNVLVELFVGSHSPDCAAPSLAADRLGDAYPSGEVVALKYHRHGFSPDPLANDDGEERWGYYAAAYRVRATPTVVIAGRPKAPGGGTPDQSRGKFVELRDAINPTLELATDVQIDLRAFRSGDRVTLSATLTGLGYDADNLKLRFALAEDEVRYSGAGGLRLHRNVIRAMPGGAAGLSLKQPTETRELTVSLNELRTRLLKEMNDYAIRVQPFADPFRPVELKKLWAVAWVQDEKSHVVLQVARYPVPPGPP